MYQLSFCRRLAETIFRPLVLVVYVVLFGLRCWGRNKLPKQGGVLVCGNHQCTMDPIMISLCCDRPPSHLARRTLFTSRLIEWFLRFWGAIPLEREGRGIGGVKEAVRRLQLGDVVCLFPEGTRTSDGEMKPLKAGFCMIARRAGVPILPVGFDGAFQSWPRGQTLPCPGYIHYVVGDLIPVELIESMTDEQLVAELTHRIQSCFHQARAARQKTCVRPTRPMTAQTPTFSNDKVGVHS